MAVAQGQAVAGEQVEQGNLDGTMDQQSVQGGPEQVVGLIREAAKKDLFLVARPQSLTPPPFSS